VSEAWEDRKFDVDAAEFRVLSEMEEKELRKRQHLGIRAFTSDAKAAYERGELKTAVSILRASINFAETWTVKAGSLYLLALTFAEMDDVENAKEHAAWAREMDPDDEKIRAVHDALQKY